MAGQRTTRKFEGKPFQLNQSDLTKADANTRAARLRIQARVQGKSINIRVTRVGRGSWQVWVR